ncbi:MAG: hypothetical protein NVSMB51_06870 [Solirubrobacteraceae bacterium]
MAWGTRCPAASQDRCGAGADAAVIGKMVVALEEAHSGNGAGAEYAVGVEVEFALDPGHARAPVAMAE